MSVQVTYTEFPTAAMTGNPLRRDALLLATLVISKKLPIMS